MQRKTKMTTPDSGECLMQTKSQQVVIYFMGIEHSKITCSAICGYL